MSNSEQQIENLRSLLQLERQEEIDFFKKEIQRLSIAERKEKGYCWYPARAIKSGYTYGERAYVVLERDAGAEEAHLFRAGKVVSLFTQQPDAYRPERSGVAQFVERNRMKIIFNSRDLPEWLHESVVGVDLLFDERSYREMDKALKKLLEARRDRLAELREIVYGNQPAHFVDDHRTVEPSHLNEAQQAAVSEMLAGHDFTLIHGPPGTGKTTTLVEGIRQLVQQENNVLVCAPSNTAVDVLVERLAKAELKVVRLGNISRVDEELIQHTLEAKLAAHPESKNIKKLKLKAEENRKLARQYKRNYGRDQKMKRRRLKNEARELKAWADQLEKRLLDQMLYSAQVVCCTLVSASNPVLEPMQFKTVIIDEAAQALEPATWIPILKAQRVILTGDPFQLPPTVKSRDAELRGFSTTLLEKLLARFDRNSLLNVQYRMNERIMGFSNQRFYNGRLQAAEAVQNHRLKIEANEPVEFIDTAGCGFEEKINEKYKSRYNPEEFLILREHLFQLIDQFGDDPPPPIAIISPYREQAIYIRRAIREEEKLEDLKIVVDTIDGFQGQERPIVYISLVRSNERGEIGFLKDYRRMNVALTRAQKKLIVIGDSATLGGDDFYNSLLEYVEIAGQYRTAWEFMQ